MPERINYRETSPEFFQKMIQMHQLLEHSDLDAQARELVNIRASQVNGCAWCLSLHLPDARKAGIPDDKIDLIAVWREAGTVFSTRERAVLAWTEALTLLPETLAPDDVYGQVRAEFSEEETVQLSWAIATINSFNRMAVSMRRPPLRHGDEATS